MFVEWVYEITA